MQNNRLSKLKAFKKKHSLSYELLAHKIGVHSATVFRWFQKGVAPKSQVVLRSIDKVLEGKKSKSRE